MANTFKLKSKNNIGVSTVGIYTVPGATTTVIIGVTCTNVSGKESMLELEYQEEQMEMTLAY